MSAEHIVAAKAKKITLDTKKGKKEAYLVKDPAKTFNHQELEKIFKDFYPVAMSAFGTNDSGEWRGDVWFHMFSCDCLILAYNWRTKYADKEMVSKGIAFRSISYAKIKGKKVMYIEGTAVDPNYQGYGFYQAFTRATLNGFDYVASRTQNPVVVTALSKVFRDVYPITKAPTKEQQEIGAVLADKLGMQKKYDKRRMFARSLYSGQMNGNLPKIDNEIKRRMYHLLDVENGDCILALCKTNHFKK